MGFLVETAGLTDASDISAYGGWRSFVGRDQKKANLLASSNPSEVSDDVCSQEMGKVTLMTNMLKGFGCHQAYESLSCRNLRAAAVSYADLYFEACQRLSRTSARGAVRASRK